MDEPLLHRLAVALGVGLIVGVERGWRSRLEAGGQRPNEVTVSRTGPELARYTRRGRS